MKIEIYQDGILKHTISGEDSGTKAFGWMLRNQGQSVDWALRYGGWSVKETDETGEETFWKPYSITIKN